MQTTLATPRLYDNVCPPVQKRIGGCQNQNATLIFRVKNLDSGWHGFFTSLSLAMEGKTGGLRTKPSDQRFLCTGGTQKGSSCQSSLKGQDGATVNQTKHRNCFKAAVVETSKKQGGAPMGFPLASRYHLDLCMKGDTVMLLPVRVSLVLGSEHRQQKAEEDGNAAETHKRHYWK